MVDTIQKTLNSIFLVTFILGCGILRYPLDQPRYRLSILYMLTVWSGYACAVYYINIQYFTTDFPPDLLMAFIVIMNLSVTVTTIIVTVCKHEKFHVCLKKLEIVNDTLEELGTPKEYHNLRNWTKWMLIMWFLMLCTTWIFDALPIVEIFNDTRALIIPIILNYSLHINSIVDVIFMTLLRYIGSRLDQIKDYILRLSETEDCELRYNWKKSLVVKSHYLRDAESRKYLLWIVIHLHLELCRITHNINGFFGMQMTLQMLCYFIFLTGAFIFQYNTILNQNNLLWNDIELKIFLSNNIWFIIFLIKLLSLNYICESVSAKARKTKDVVHTLTNLMYFDELREEISQFRMQILLRPLQISGLGLFYFGYDFIRKFFAWILTAVLFMVQIYTVPFSQIRIKYNITHYDHK